jgi:poly-gamma-glutamate capsule biosynthesis protein CapA/YwtB (metallophosphatase superfamily)
LACRALVWSNDLVYPTGAVKLSRLLVPVILLSAACSPVAGPTAPSGAQPLPVVAASLSPTPTPAPSPPPLALASIFGSDKPDLSQFDPSQLRVLIATGDVIPAREVNYKMVVHHDWLYPWRQTADYLRSGDLLFINLESPLIAGCPIIHGGFRFCGDARAIAGLDYARVAVANIANNHFTNFGPTGVNATILLLAHHNIGVSGLGHWDVRDDRGLKFGFVGFNGIGTHIDRVEMKREIAVVRAQADVVVVAFHWGKEYELVPTVGPGIAPDDPRQIGHLAIDDGADLVIGNHPHWVQGVEIYRGKLITYAHGNFIFDQMWSQETREGVVGRYTFYGTQLIRVDYRPVLISDYAQPAWLDDTTGEGLAILKRMEHSSHLIAGIP